MTLHEDLLERLLEAWRAQGAPIAGSLAPGRDVACFESDDGSVRVELPEELRAWWRWHDGAATSTDPVARMLGPGRFFLSSNESRALWQRLRDVARTAAAAGEGAMGDPDYWWHAAWIPLTPDGSGYVAADCELGAPVLAPVRRVEAGPDFEELSRPRAHSLGELVGWWTEAIALGGWTFDEATHGWRRTATHVHLKGRDAGLA